MPTRWHASGALGVWSWLKRAYLSCDVRFLGLFRILLGALLCILTIERWANARAFYSNDGILPNHFALFRPFGEVSSSLFFAFSTPAEVSVAFALSFLAFALFLVGYKTRLCHLVSAVCAVGINARNPLLETPGMTVLTLLVCWTLFLPLHRRFSLDAVLESLKSAREGSVRELREPLRRGGSDWTSLAVPLILLQCAIMYGVTALQMDGTPWRDGNALYFYLQQDAFVRPVGVWLRAAASPELLRVLTHAMRWILAVIAGLLLLPFARHIALRLASGLVIALAGALSLCASLAPLPAVMLLFQVLWLQNGDFQWLGRWFGAESRRRTVIFDSDCGICFQACRVLKRFDPFQRLHFVSNQERAGIPEQLTAETLQTTVVVIDQRGRIFIEERAVFEILRALPFGIAPGLLLRVPGLSGWWRGAYRKLADNRIRVSSYLGFGACGTTTRTPQATAPRAVQPQAVDGVTLRGLLANIRGATRELLVCGVGLLFALELVADNPVLRRHVSRSPPEAWLSLLRGPRLFQPWHTLAADPPREQGCLVVDGRTEEGNKLDPLTGHAPLSSPSPGCDGPLWAVYASRIHRSAYRPNRQHLRDYLLNQHAYRDGKAEKLVSFEVWWLHERVRESNKTRHSSLKRDLILKYGHMPSEGKTKKRHRRRHPRERPFSRKRDQP